MFLWPKLHVIHVHMYYLNPIVFSLKFEIWCSYTVSTKLTNIFTYKARTT